MSLLNQQLGKAAPHIESGNSDRPHGSEPTPRQRRLDDLKERISQGTYRVSSADLAACLIQRMVQR